MASASAAKDPIREIKKRNARVEADKAWETSKTRRGIIAVSTYLIVVFFLILINAPNPWMNALVPAGAYVLSTLTLPFVKEWWVSNSYKKKA
ncbi:hypothetical protein GF412_02505 [Candidatus Micrarchaeota archaeon]|nr:hypothetical protein [Candidatus Micrarchaeota archaeon]MBD3417830.1 hypothetical protein [Candidatus Micrarchaeota archaeon]